MTTIAASHRNAATSLSSHSSENNPAQSPHSSGFYPSPGSSHPTPVDDSAESDIDLPEGPGRRFWELRLLHNQQTKMTQPFSTPQSPEVVRMWTHDIPEMAMTMAQRQGRCSLLYIMFAQSALNMWTRSTDKQDRDELIKLQQTYQLMCSKEQRRDIEELTQGIAKNADYICFASLKILAHSLALVQTLSVDPWEPPTQWLHMGRGAGQVFTMARSLMDLKSEDFSDSYILRFVNSEPVIKDPRDTILSDFSPLAWLLDHPASPSSVDALFDRELEDEETRSVYEKAMAYTCSVQRAMERGEPQYAIVRRLGAFAVWVPIEFGKFVEERKPRALVILAHFMALWLEHEDAWVLGRAGEWQIRCIHKVLPLEWSHKLDCLFARFKQQKP
ncbi:Uu.00g090290.m01.CDS01 [Anthostomella pinea]|uniref:Uu.00g090290.m01.CDS01 n=1 Tax=Anthostomella pinea TaxID=933095 RepID=A0AAI8VMY8_9PEZI|nr:Uu.00g090290.m01.CDS01 [Anthostomella pinea]